MCQANALSTVLLLGPLFVGGLVSEVRVNWQPLLEQFRRNWREKGEKRRDERGERDEMTEKREREREKGRERKRERKKRFDPWHHI